MTVKHRNFTKRAKLSYGVKILIKEAKLVFNENNCRHARKQKQVSTKTQSNRWQVIRQTLIILHDVLGFKIVSVKHIRQKHIHAVARYWEESKRLGPGTIQNNCSVLRIFFAWIGKPCLVPGNHLLFTTENVYKRSGKGRRDKSWIGNGVDLYEPIMAIFEYDEIVAVQLLLCRAFGLRVKEALSLRPYEADLGDCIQILRGSKGKRYRRIEVKNEVQRQVLELMKLYVNLTTGSTIPAEYSLIQWYRRFYYIVRNYGGIRYDQLGVTTHGLRHEYAQHEYKTLSGMVAPVKAVTERSLQNKKLDREARRHLAESLGHSRIGITGAYIGGMAGRLRDSS